MFTQHVVAQLLGELQVKYERIIRGRSVHSVGPEALQVEEQLPVGSGPKAFDILPNCLNTELQVQVARAGVNLRLRSWYNT